MRRVTPISTLLAAVFLTVAASASFTPVPSGVVAPNVTPLWLAGIVALIIFIGSESAWLKEAIPFLRTHRSKLRRLIERGQAFKIQVRQLPMTPRQARIVSDDELASLGRWADDCDAFATGLDEPTFSFGLTRLRREEAGDIFYMYIDVFLDARLERLITLDDAAHKADRG